MDWFAETEFAATSLIAGRINNTISVEEALKHPVIASGYSSQRKDGYLHLSPNGYDAERDPSGWKFHLSVDPTQIKDAFNHIALDLMKEGISLKVAEARKHEGLGDESNSQKGKAIVIYAKEGQDITPILKRIEQKLTDAGIKPGPTVNDDKKLGGSNFMFYRNDQDAKGNYISAASLERLPAEQRFNPTGRIDPYQNLDVSPVKPATIRPTQSADHIKFPGENASAEEHLKYLIAATRHIADSEPSADEKYRQRIHGDGVTIGDPKKPAILNASYIYGNRSLASISMPDYVKMEYGINFENGDVKIHPGLSKIGISSSLQAVLKSQGIEIDGGETKVGHDKMTGTHYIEMDLIDRTKYGHALAIVDAITQGRDKSPEAVMQQIKAINPANPIRPIPQVNQPAPHATPIAPVANTPIDPKAESRQIIATSPITEAEKKGKDGQVKKFQYMGVGSTPLEVEDIENNLKKQGFNIGIDYDVKPSSLNGGGNVISLTEQGASRVQLIQHLHQQEMSKPQPSAPAQPAAKPEQAHLDAASQNARAQLADPNYKPATQTTPSVASSGTPSTGGRIESHTKVAGSGVGIGMGVYGFTQKFGEDGTAAGDLKNKDTRTMAQAGIVADGSAILVDTAESLSSLKKVSDSLKSASKVSRVAAPVGVALSVASGVIDYKIADKTKDAGRASDAIGGSAGGMAGAAAGGIVGAKTGAAIGAAVGVWFGGIGAAPGAAIGGFVGGVAGAIGGAFVGSEAGKKVAEVTIKDSFQKKYDEEKRAEVNQLKSMPKADLAKNIQADPDLPHKLNLRGQEVTLVQAMEDKTFRATMIKNMEAEAKKNPALDPKVAALKEYGARLDASAPQQSQQATAKPATATPPSIANPTPSAAEAQYKSLSTTQLASAIQKDPTLVDTVKIGKNDVLLADALKDKDFRKSFISGLEKAQAGGSDLQEQIAMVKAYETALGKPQQQAPPSVQVAQQQPPKMAAAAMI